MNSIPSCLIAGSCFLFLDIAVTFKSSMQAQAYVPVLLVYVNNNAV